MKKRSKIVAAGAASVAVAAGGASIAIAGGEDDSAEQVSGAAADKATAAALENVDGTANAVERDSENGGTWEVEVSKPDGSVVDVRLDENYDLVQVDGDSEESGDTEESGDSEESGDTEESGDSE